MCMTYEKCIEVHWRMFCASSSNLSLSLWLLTLRENVLPLACQRCYAKMCWSASQEVWYFNSASVAYGPLSLSLSLSVHDLQEISYHLHVQDSLQKRCAEICCTTLGSSMKLQWFVARMLLSPLQICWGTTNAQSKVRRQWKLAKRQ